MSVRPELTFIPGDPVPAGGSFVLWQPDTDNEGLVASAVALGLPEGTPAWLPTIEITDDGVRPVDVPARSIPVLAVVRRLAEMPPGSDWPGWSRPKASVLGWSVAAKLALELVAGGRIVPTLRPGNDPTEALASWRVATADDQRLAQLAEALPLAASAVRRSSGTLWSPHELVAAFLDAVADACAREGRRPEFDPRRRAPRGPLGEMWAAALTGSDPTVTHLRVPADELSTAVAGWASPLLGDQRRSAVRLSLRLQPPAFADDGSDTVLERLGATDQPWELTYHLQSVRDRLQRLSAEEVWARAGGPIQLGDQLIDDAELVLVRGLATAARLYPPIDGSLSESQPVGTQLDAGEVAELLSDGVDALAAAGIGIELPPELRGSGAHKVRLRVRLGASTVGPPRVEGASPLGITGLTDLHYEIAIGDQTLSAEEFAEIVAAGQPLVRWRGSWVQVDRDEADRIQQLAGEGAALELTEALAAALSGQLEVEDLGYVEAVPDGQLGQLLTQLRDADGPGEAQIVGIEGRLRPYQQRGVAWLQRLSELGMGAVLADEMGLGKTLQAIALLTSRDQDRPHLVVCPTSVVGNWERELGRFAPDLPVMRHHGSDRAQSRRVFRPGQVTVTSYALLRRDIGLLEDIPWDVVVFDEAQQIKNPSSKGAQAARSLTSRTRIAMTGTPIENRLSELWAIIDTTNPGLLGSHRSFNERFAVPIERWHDQQAASRLKRLVAPFVLRRRKSEPEVAVDLPPKQEVQVICSLTREQASLYQAAVDQAFSGEGLGSTAFERRGRVLALLTALKQICNHPRHYLRDGGRLAGRSGKLTRAVEILSEVVDAGDRALVFTQFREMGELLAPYLKEHLGVPEVPFLHGGVPLAARDAMVHRFQEAEDAPPVLLVSLRAGGTGLNLTRASHVLHYDRWWNPAVEDQATDRVHRIGQTRAVTVHSLVTAGTIEERIAGLLERKRTLADAIVGTGETWITELNDDELRELVELSTADLADEEDDLDLQTPQPPRLTAITGGLA